MRKLWLSKKCPHQEISWNYGIFGSVSWYLKMKSSSMCIKLLKCSVESVNRFKVIDGKFYPNSQMKMFLSAVLWNYMMPSEVSFHWLTFSAFVCNCCFDGFISLNEQMLGIVHSCYLTLIHFMPLVSFDTPWKHQKTSGFLMFSGVKRDKWHGMGW